MTMGGIAREDSYEYLGQDDFCASSYMAGSDKRSSSLAAVKARPVRRFSHCCPEQLMFFRIWPCWQDAMVVVLARTAGACWRGCA